MFGGASALCFNSSHVAYPGARIQTVISSYHACETYFIFMNEKKGINLALLTLTGK